MGGNKNRTRNNVRPSNSGRSAAMLHSSLPQFTGFTSTKPTGLSSFAFNPADELDKSLDSNFQLVLKKVSKKDCTTKLKGLQEFGELLQDAEPGVVKTLLATWTRFYSVLVIHPDNRVREAAQNAHCIIVQKLKRDIAPHLKQLMAPWYISQYDNYPPAATAATKAFNETFSPVKFQEAVIFCHQEIINYIHNNLLVQTSQTVASGQLSAEEAEARYERIVISCLQGYAMYLQEVPVEKIMECQNLNNEILSNKKFWKLSQSKLTLIRASWFQVLRVILQKGIFLLNGKESQAFTAILNNLEEQESIVVTHVWDCLILATAIPEWWKYVNVDQLFTPKILKVLKQGGFGHASKIYPNLLLLLSHLSAIAVKTVNTFYPSFFNSLLTGLKQKQVVSSIPETRAIATALRECLQFAITQNISNPAEYRSLLMLVDNCIEWCFLKEATSYKIIFGEIATLISNLAKQKGMVEELFQLLTEVVKRPLITGSISLIGAQFSQLAMKHIDLLLALKSATEKNTLFSRKLLQIALILWSSYSTLDRSVITKELIASLVNLVQGLGKRQFFRALPEHCKVEAVGFRMMDIYSTLFKDWLVREETFCRSAVDMVFLLLEELNDEEKETVLNDLLLVNQPDCIPISVMNALSPPHNSDPVVQNWLKGDAVARYFVDIVDQSVNGHCTPEQSALLKAALTEASDGSLLLDKTIIKQIVQKVSAAVVLLKGNPNSYKLAADISALVYTQTSLLTYGDELLFSLFYFSCQFTDETNVALDEVSAAWTNSLAAILTGLSDAEGRLLLEAFLKRILDYISRSITQKNRHRYEVLKRPIGELIRTVHRSRPWLLTFIIDYPAQEIKGLNEEVLAFCEMAEYIKGFLTSRRTEITVKKEFIDEDFLRYFTYSFLIIELLNTPLCEDQDSEPDVVKSIHSDRTLEAFQKPEKVAEIVYLYAIHHTYLTHFNLVKNYTELMYYHNLSENTVFDVIKQLGDDVLQATEEILQSRASEECWLWFKALYLYRSKFTLKTDYELKRVENELKTLEGAAKAANRSVMEVVQDIEKVRQGNLDQFLYKDCTISWENGGKIIDAIEKCIILMDSYDLTTNYWDLVVLSMDSWASSCLQHARKMIHHYQYQCIVVAVTTLYAVTCKKVAKLKDDNQEVSRVQEWEDVVIESVHANLTKIWLFAADYFGNSEENSMINLPFMQRFGQIIDSFRSELIFKESSLSPKWTVFLKTSKALLTNSSTVLQLWGYKMLRVLVPGLVKIDGVAVNNAARHKNGLIFEQLKAKLVELQDIVNSVLDDFRIGESSCLVETSYDSFTYTFAYLVLWDVVIRFFDEASVELRYQYSDWLREGPLLHEFLINLFKLLPVGALQKEDSRDASLSNMFLNNPIDQIDYEGYCGSNVIEHFACYLFKSALEQFPALIRQWWNVLDVKSSQLVEKIIVMFVSPLICSSELNDVVRHQSGFKNLKVKILPSVREIQAVYVVDEAQMELTVTLPPNYPLGSPDIVCDRQISGASQKQWLLQFKKCVLHQNGKIWDGLTLWNANLDKKFDGVEECYICYAVLHAGTYQMPKVTCRTCKKKFHSVCLYKWFSTSNKSSCPICRNLF